MAKTTRDAETNRLLQLNTTSVPASSVHPNKYNPNYQDEHEFGLLIKSISDDGFTQPIIVQKDTHDIVDGEHRWTAMIVLGFLNKHWPGQKWPARLLAEARSQRLEILNARDVKITVPGFEGTYAGTDTNIDVVFSNFTEEQMKMATLRHNRARGSEDFELLAAVLMDLKESGAQEMAMEALSMEQDEFSAILNSLAGETMQGEQVETFIAEAGTRAQTKALEERSMAAQDAAIFRLSLLYTGDEATIVKAVLGSSPAARIVEICAEEFNG